MEPAVRDGLDHVRPQDEMLGVRLRDQNALLAGEAAAVADIEKTLDLLVDAADGLHLAMLIDRTGNGDILLDG